MVNLTAEQHDILQEMLKVITEARQTSERLSESWAKGLANPIGPHTNHQSLQTQENVTNPNQSVEAVTNLELFKETVKNSEPLEHESVLQVSGSVSDVFLVHRVDSHIKEVEELPQKSTNGNGENVAHQVFDQKPVRVTNKEKHLKHLKGWKFKFKGKNLSRVMPQIGQYELMERKCKRDNKFSSNIRIEPMRTRISWEHWRVGKRQRISPFQLRYDTRSYLDVFLPIWLRAETKEKQHTGLSRAERVWKPGELVFLQKQWAWLSVVHNRGIIVNLARRLCGTNLSTKLFSPPLTDFQNWKKELGSLTLCSNIGLEEWICGLEIYGCGTKKHMLLLVKLANRVWDCGGTPLECVDESSCYVKSSEEAVTVLEARPQLLNIFLRICEYNKVDNSWVCNDRQKGAVCDAVYENLLNIKAGAKKGTNSCLGGKIAKVDKEEFVGLTEYSELRPSREYLLMNFEIFMNPQPLHDKRVTRALLVGLVGTEEKLSDRLSLANYVWKPGELLCVQDQWDWISEVLNMGSVLKIMQRFHGLQGIINIDMKFQEVIVHDVLSVKVCLSVCNRKFEAELEVYLLAHHNSRIQMIASGLIYGDANFHLKHKWRSRLLQTLSRLEFCVDNVILFTSSVKLLFPKNHKLLHYEADFSAQYNDLKQLSIEFQSYPGLDYFTYLIFKWNQALNYGCEAGHISSGFSSVGDVHEFFTCSKLQNGDETYGKKLLDVNEVSLLDNDNKVDFTIKASWCYRKPMIREVFHLQRPPEVIDLHGNLDFITKVIVHWKEHPPDQFSQAFMGKYSCFHL